MKESQKHWLIGLNAFALILVGLGVGEYVHHRIEQSRTHSGQLTRELNEADDLAWNNQWYAASPIYRDIETRARVENDASLELDARVSQFVVRAEAEPIGPLLCELQSDLRLPAAHAPETHLRVLVIEGMLATNVDAGSAKHIWQEVEHEARNRFEYRLMMRAEGEQGIASFLLGDVSSAKRSVTRAWLAAKYLHDPAAEVRYASVYGTGLVELQRYDEAIRVLDEAINTANKNKQVAYPSIAINAKIDALRGLRRYAEALELSSTCLERLQSDHLDAHLFQIELSRGRVFDDMSEWGHAENEYDHAVQYARRVGYWRGIAQAEGLLAISQMRLGDLSEAHESIDSAIIANEHLPQELYLLPKNLAIKAAILHEQKQRRASDILYARSIRIVNILLSRAAAPNDKRLLITALRRVYTGYAEALEEDGRTSAAFRVIESARGRIEAEFLEGNRRQMLPESSADSYLVSLNIRLMRTGDGAQRRKLDEQLDELELQVDDDSPDKTLRHSPCPLDRVRRALHHGEMVLEYVLDDPHSFVIAITPTGTHLSRLASREEIGRRIVQYRQALARRSADPADAQALFDELLGNVPEYRTAMHIIVVPDQELHLLPFGALMDRGRYVIATKDFSVVSSSTVLYLLRARPPTGDAKDERFLGVASWTEDDEWAFPPTEYGVPLPGPLEALPATRKEVLTAAAEAKRPATMLFGEDATETRFKQLPLDKFAILHLALHGYADLEAPDRSALIFAPEPKGPDDGLLTIREIRNLTLNARLVTLSACDTGRGPIGEADVANLANAFMDAGAKAVVASLWNADDKATAGLMQVFYEQLGHGDSVSMALSKSQMTLIAKGLTPYYWATFEVSGDGSVGI